MAPSVLIELLSKGILLGKVLEHLNIPIWTTEANYIATGPLENDPFSLSVTPSNYLFQFIKIAGGYPADIRIYFNVESTSIRRRNFKTTSNGL